MIKFITEEHLKDLYKKESFKEYRLKSEERLTPGGRQYLLDKGININNNLVKNEKKELIIKEKAPQENNYKKQKNNYKLKGLETLFFSTASECLTEDIISAQKIINFGRNIKNLRNVIENKAVLENIDIEICDGIEIEDYKECFEITDAYMQLEKGGLILKVYYLICKLRELQYEITEFIESKDLKNIDRNINKIIHGLTQIICLMLGGIKCQRKK